MQTLFAAAFDLCPVWSEFGGATIKHVDALVPIFYVVTQNHQPFLAMAGDEVVSYSVVWRPFSQT
jgi:hypothetical protein